MAGRMDDPSWSPGHQEGRVSKSRQASERTSARGRKPIPTPAGDDLDSLSDSEKVKIARRIRNRVNARQSRLKKAQTKPEASTSSLREEVAELRVTNARLQTTLADKDSQIEALTSEIAGLKAHHEAQLNSTSPILGIPIREHSYPSSGLHHLPGSTPPFFSGSPDLAISSGPLTPTAPMSQGQNTIKPPPPRLAAPISALGDSNDLHSVMQWKYPGCETLHVSGEEDMLPVFTPFAAVSTPKESLFAIDRGVNLEERAMFGGWRPKEGDEEWGEVAGSSGGVGSGTARELARLASSPAVLRRGF